MANRQHVINDRQISILKKLAIRGKQTKSELSTEFNVRYPAIVGSMKILHEKKMIEIAEKKKGRGRAKLFYEITNKGLDTLSKDSRMSLEEFWEISFLVYDVKTNLNVTSTLEEFCSNYEQKVLGYSFEYALLGWSIIMDNSGIFLPISDKPSQKMSVLYELGVNGTQSTQELTKYLDLKTRQKNNLNALLSDMVRNKIISETQTNKKSKYQLTSLGFLLLMNYMDKDKMENLNINNGKDHAEDIRRIIKNADTVPLISNHWQVLREIIDELNITQFFKWIANSLMPPLDAIQLRGVSELIIVERIMGETYKNLIAQEFNVGLKVISNIMKEKKYEPKSSKVYRRLLYLGILTGIKVENQDKFLHSVMGKDFVLDEVIEKTVSNKICFEFFTYFINWVIGEKKRGDLDKIKNDGIGKWYYSTVEKWDSFQKSNKEFRDWYNAWIDEIRIFEERNTKILKERDFLEV